MVELQISLVDARRNSFSGEANLVGFDPDYDLAVLKVLFSRIVIFFLAVH